MKNVALIGMGENAKNFYLKYLKKHKINLALVVDLESKKESTLKYLKENDFNNTKIFTLEDAYKNDEYLSNETASNLLAICNLLEITNIILGTNARAHHMYLDFALKNDINVLTDTPVLTTADMSRNAINKVKKQYYELFELAKNSKANIKVMNEKKYHKGYEKVKEVLSDVVSKYQTPITYIDIFSKTNNSLKSFDNLYQNGYHFIDLLSDLVKINDILDSDKITSGEVYTKVANNDLNTNEEENYHGLLSFYNEQGNTITTANLNLLSSNRDDIKQERINIEVGNLLTIQVHSYQTLDAIEENQVGGKNHFDIYFFRNPITDMKPFKIIHISDLYNQVEMEKEGSYEDLAKEKFLNDFLYNKNCAGDILNQELSIEILHACIKGIYNNYNHKNKVEKIFLDNEKPFINNENLKKYFKFLEKPMKNDVVNEVTHYYNMYQLNIKELYVSNKDCYEVYITIDDDKKIENGVLSKNFKTKIAAFCYFKYLVYITKNKKMHKIIKDFERL